ncbi:MAG: double-transrane region domain protein [Bacteroidota bacterium]|nr:double-transrane region domain protein [Bacteroidota bacterium]
MLQTQFRYFSHMQFLHSGFLFALSALAIPVVIHLFNFRRYKTVYFSNVKFLREVKEETTSRSRLKHLLVLAARLLALLFLVFAFAQPYIPNKKNQLTTGKKFVSVYVDNSFSMNAVSGGLSLFDKAKQAAKEVVRNYSADDQFQLLSNDFMGKHQRLVGKEEFISMVDELEISPSVRNLSEIAKRQKDALSRENGRNQVAYMLSDFQRNMGDFTIDSAIAYNLVPLAADAQANVYIDTCWFNEPVQLLNQQSQLIVKISNSGEKAVENNRLALKLNGQAKAMADFSIQPGSFVYDTISFVLTQAGWNKAELAVQDYPITYDDNYYLAFNVIEKIKVLSVGEGRPNVFLDALFKDQNEFSYNAVSTTGFDASALSANQLVILDGLRTISSSLSASLSTYVADGGAVAVFPGDKCETEAYNRFLNNFQANSISGFSEQPQDLAGINLQQNIFKDVFERVPQNLSLPHVNKYYTFTRSTTSNEESILTLKDGNSFFSRYPFKSGSLYVCAAPLDKNFSDLPVHAIFVPMLYKMAVLNIKTGSIGYFIGDKTRIEVDAKKVSGADKVYKIKGDNVEFIPEQFAVGNKILLGLNDQIKKAGFYKVGLDRSDSTELLALNFDRKESDLKFFDAAQLKEKYPQGNVNVVNAANAEVASVVKELDRGTSLWKLCIILALLFLAIEITLLRFWKV